MQSKEHFIKHLKQSRNSLFIPYEGKESEISFRIGQDTENTLFEYCICQRFDGFL